MFNGIGVPLSGRGTHGWGVGNPLGAPSIMYNADAWYRGDRLVTLNGSTVSKWTDINNGVEATQTTESSQPTYDADAINERPGLVFDGDNDHLRADSLASLASGDDQPIYALTVFNGSADGCIWSFGRSTDDNPLFALMVVDGSLQLWRRDDAASEIKINCGSAQDDTSIYLEFNGTTLNTWNNGVKTVTSANIDLGVTTLDRFTIGALGRTGETELYNGTISEVAIT